MNPDPTATDKDPETTPPADAVASESPPPAEVIEKKPDPGTEPGPEPEPEPEPQPEAQVEPPEPADAPEPAPAAEPAQAAEPEAPPVEGEPEPELIIDTSKMSDGKRAALELAESSRDSVWRYPTFAGRLFMGTLPWDLIHPYPQPSEEDTKKGEAFLKELETFLRENVDPDAIDREGEIPDDVIEGLAKMGAFGIKIPEAYGGLGHSQVTYCRAATLLGSYCANLTALLSAHQSIGIPQPLLLFGTEEQKQKYLPKIAEGMISAFALTEDSVGSDPAKMETIATPTDDGEHFIINGRKLWCTNGIKAGAIVVMARTPSVMVKGKPKNQITAFVVDMDMRGVQIKHRCRFMGLKALYNAVIEFKEVRVPRANIVLGEGKGLRVALTTLNTGRLTLPAGCLGGAKRSLQILREWSNERVQWGHKIGRHAAIADKIARAASDVFAMEAMTLLTAGLVDRKETDIRIEAAMCKMWVTEAAWHLVDETMQVRGGRGYETADSLRARGEKPIAVERMMRDSKINMIFEGSSEIMRLFIAREALDPHLQIGAAVMNSRLPKEERRAAALKAFKFYAKWYPLLWLPIGDRVPSGMDGGMRGHARYAARTSRRLARAMFHAMVRYGPKLEEQGMTLGRLVDIGTEIFAVAAVASRGSAMIKGGAERKEVRQLVDHFVKASSLRINEHFRALRRNADKKGWKLSGEVLEKKYAWLEEGMVRE